MLNPLEKYFKEYSMYVLMELGPKGHGYNHQFVPTVGGGGGGGGCYNRALRK